MNPQQEIESWRAKFNNIKKENDFYLKAREKAINEKIKNKISEKIETRPLYYISSK